MLGASGPLVVLIDWPLGAKRAAECPGRQRASRGTCCRRPFAPILCPLFGTLSCFSPSFRPLFCVRVASRLRLFSWIRRFRRFSQIETRPAGLFLNLRESAVDEPGRRRRPDLLIKVGTPVRT